MKKKDGLTQCKVFTEDVDKILWLLYTKLDFYFKCKKTGICKSTTGFHDFGGMIPTIFRLATRFWCKVPMKIVFYNDGESHHSGIGFKYDKVSIDEIPF